ncbi:MAG: right-handed parallel beta-helix repeat-containing protein [Pseudomonadota bacterium]
MAVTGNDSNPGTAEEPLRSISAAASIAEPGDTITVHEGVYREQVNPPRGGVATDKRITYEAAAGDVVEIKGSEQVTGWQRAENDTWKVVLENSFFGDFNPYNDELSGHWFYASGQPDNVTKNAERRKSHTGAVYLNGAWLNEAATLEEVLKPAGTQPVWFAFVTDTKTSIWAQFPQVNPNRELVEINVRQTVFFPEEPGLDYITVRGFAMSHAATPWAPPTQKQLGLIGTHWSKGWIIEDNDISHAVTACVQLGIKEFGEFPGNVHGMNEIFRFASESGEWHRDNVGGHIVRRNRIHNCGATGINGNMGASFSLIEGNHIFDIHRDRSWSGLEQGGIKLHAAVDTIVRNNVIYRAAHGRARALWIDWLAQGTVIEGNVCFDNERTDLFLEVSHGPTLVNNNVFLSKTSITSTSRGAAYVNNYIAGSVVISATTRRTPYAEPHTTELIGVQINQPLDDRFMNNIFAGSGPAIRPGFGGVTAGVLDALPFDLSNNLYLNGTLPPSQETNPHVVVGADPPFSIVPNGRGHLLEWNLDQSWAEGRTRPVVRAADLGLTHVGKHPFEYADGTPVVIDLDMFGNERNKLNTMPGPVATPGKGATQLSPK